MEKKYIVLKNFLLLVLKCLKFKCFVLQSQLKNEVFNVIEVYSHSDPLLRADASTLIIIPLLCHFTI